MNLNKWFVGGILAVLVIVYLIWAEVIVLSSSMFLYILLIMGAGGGFAYFSRVSSGRMVAKTEFARNFAMGWWSDNFKGEKLKEGGSRGTKRVFENTTFYAFRFSKQNKPGTALVIVEKTTTGYDIAEHIDNPTKELWENPWTSLSGYLKGSPVERPPLPEPVPGHGWGNWGNERKPTVEIPIYTQEKEIKKLEKE
jgi:hypothetical protein